MIAVTAGPADTVLRDLRIPRALVAVPDRFGGRLEGEFLRGDLAIRAGRATALLPAAEAPPADGLGGRIVLPRLIEAHCHLDKAFTAARLDLGGCDLPAAIAAQAADKIRWTAEDIRDRAARGLAELVAAGCRAVRSHVDWGTADDPWAVPPAWEVLRELRRDWAHLIDLQLSILPAISAWSDPVRARDMARALARDGGVAGAFVYDQPDRAEGLRAAFALADRFGLALDFHVDEGLAPALDGLDLIAAEATRSGFQGPVLCGHACSLMNRTGAALRRRLDAVAAAGLSVAGLPSTNLMLQGRGGGTPDRRGVTRLRELQAAGVNVAVATDNVCDAFFPIGSHDPLGALALAVPAAHLDPPLGRWLPMVTTAPARALGLAPAVIDGARIADLLLTPATDAGALLSTPPAGRKPLSDFLSKAMP
jgi:cytosine deaminase